MEDIRGARLRKFNLRKIILGVRMHFRHNTPIVPCESDYDDGVELTFDNIYSKR